MRLGWMVQLQNSPTPLQARPARPRWPPPSPASVPRSRGPGGAPGPLTPGPQGAQRRPRGLLSGPPRRRAGRGGQRRPCKLRGRPAAPRPRLSGPIGVGSRVCANCSEDNGRWRNRSERGALGCSGGRGAVQETCGRR